MYYLEDKERKFILFWSARVACTSMRFWFCDLTDTKAQEGLGGQMATFEKMHDTDSKRIIVVRNPISRFVSILNHTIIYAYIEGRIPHPHDDKEWSFVKYKGADRIDPFLDYLERDGLRTNHHFELQCLSPDRPDWHKHNDVSKMMTHIIKVEDYLPIIELKCKNNPEKKFPSVIPELNRIVGSDVIDWTINTGRDARDLFIKKGIEYVTINDLTDTHIERIKKLYHYDFKHFYPNEL